MKRLLFVLLSAALLSGCILAPAIDSFKRMGVTKGDRGALLVTRVREFHEALYWGRPDQALALVEEEHRRDFSNQLVKLKRTERITESTVDNITLSEDGYSADVDVTIKYLDIERQTNVVNKRYERQQWRFGMTSGWLIAERSEVS